MKKGKHWTDVFVINHFCFSRPHESILFNSPLKLIHLTIKTMLKPSVLPPNTPFLLNFALVLVVFPAPSELLGKKRKKERNKKQVSPSFKAQMEAFAVSVWRRGQADSHSHFTGLALLRSQRGQVRVWAAQLLHGAFGCHAVQLAHHQLVKVVGVGQPCHQQAQTSGKQKQKLSQHALMQ